MDSTTLLACNKRYIVSALGDRISTRRTNETLSLLKPDFLGHKGEVTHVAIHQPDHLYGTQDDWGRVVASSDVTNRVKVWLCDGEEEELMFARNMAEYVGYEKVTALAWTADSKVAIGDVSGNFIVFNARYATSRYNRTLAKSITSIAPSHNDPHIHAVGYEDGAILLIRTNPTFQILFTNSKAHSAPIVSLAWRPEFSAARTYTEKDGKVHKSSAEDMALLASGPCVKGEFRIWAWSAKTEKLTGFRDGNNGSEEAGVPNATGALYWSRNGKVVQFIESEVRIWDVKKLQIQSESFLPASDDLCGIAVDGHRGIIYTLASSGVVEKHLIPAKPTNPALPTPLPPAPAPIESPSSIEPERAPTPLKIIEAERAPTPQLRVPTPPRASTPEPPKSLRIPEPITEPKRPVSPSPVDRSSSETSIDSLSKVKQMARQFDEDGISKKKNNFIANAKAMYQPDRRKRTFSNESDLLSNLSRTASPDPDRILESRVTNQKTTSSIPAVSRQPSLFDIATSRVGNSDDVRRQENSNDAKHELGSQTSKKDERPPTKIPAPTDTKRSRTPEPLQEKPTYQVVPTPEPSLSFKPLDYTTRQPSPVPLAVTIPNDPVSSSSTGSATITPNHVAISPSIDRLQSQPDFLESPVLGVAMYGGNMPVTQPVPHIEPISEPELSYSPIYESPTLPISSPLQTIPEETPALNILKQNSIPGLSIVKTESFEGGEHVKMTFDLPTTVDLNFTTELHENVSANKQTEPPPAAPWISSPPSSSASSKLAEPTSSYEDLGGISMDDQDHAMSDARSDTSVEPMDDDIKPPSPKVLTPQPKIAIPEVKAPSTPVAKTHSATPETSPVGIKASPSSRASRIWAEKNGTQIHTQIVEYMSDGEEETPSPYQSAVAEQPPSQPVRSSSSETSPIDHMGSPTPYKHSLKEYDLFRGLTRKLASRNKDHLDAVIATKLTQQNICKMVFGYNNIRELIQDELDLAQKQNIGLSELVLKLWLGVDIDDEALLKAILFGKNNGLSDALILSVAPLAGIEVWESLMLWCTEVPSATKADVSQADIFKGNLLVRTHLYAGFLCFTGSWREAMGVYRKAKMYREAILMALMTLVLEERESERLVNTMKDLFRNWGDQVASQNGDGLLVSMCFAASMVSYEPTVKPRKQSRTDGSRSPVIPVIRTQKPSPTDSSQKSIKSGSTGLDSPQGRNWAELATFMRTQREKGFAEIRAPKTVHFKNDSPQSGSSSPSLSIPSRSRNGSRPNSPAGRAVPVRRYAEDEDWSASNLRRYPSPRVYMDERAPSPAPRRPSLSHQSPRSRSPALDSSSSRRKVHDAPSPLTFGARGTGVKPYVLPSAQDAPMIPQKDEKRDRARGDDKKRGYEDERKERVKSNGIGLGIQGHGARERVGRI